MRKKDYLSVIEPLNEEYYESPDHRLYWLKLSAGTSLQYDKSRWEKITYQNYRDIISHQRRVDIPANNQYAMKVVRDWLDEGRDVYRYWYCWVNEIVYQNGKWIYMEQIADLKGMSPKTISEYCSSGPLTCRFISLTGNYPKRRYVKDDSKLKRWLVDA